MFIFICFVFLFFWDGFIVFEVYIYFIMNDLVYFVDWNIATLNGISIVIMFLSDWMSLLFELPACFGHLLRPSSERCPLEDIVI